MAGSIENGVKTIVSQYSPNAKQKIAEASTALYTLFGGSRGGGKTTWLCNTMLKYLWEYPGNRGFMCRKVFTDFRMTTYQTLMKWIPWDTVKRHDQNDKEIEFINGSILLYGGLDDRNDVERMKGAEFGIIAPDQIEEFTEEDFNMFTPTLRHILPDLTRPPYKIIATANPAQNWVKEKWLNSVDSDYVYIPSTCKDNAANLPPNYEDLLRKQWKNRPEMVAAFVEGDWNAQAQENVVIKYNHIIQAAKSENRRPYNGALKRVIACDPARYGDDSTTVYAFRNYEVIGSDTWSMTDTMTTAGKLIILKEKYKANTIAIDTNGLGAGIYDRLKEMGQTVIPIDSASKSSRPERYRNLRAQMWEEASIKFFEGYPIIPHDTSLMTELNTVQYRIINSNGTLQIEEKDDIKKRLGHSPDKGDCLVYGLYAVDRAMEYSADDRAGQSQIKAIGQCERIMAASDETTGGW